MDLTSKKFGLVKQNTSEISLLVINCESNDTFNQLAILKHRNQWHMAFLLKIMLKPSEMYVYVTFVARH